jgi:rod shape-determining protein MreD
VSATRAALLAVVALVALVIQQTVLSRLPLPGGRPDLVLLVVLAVALAGGELAGTLGGFGAGLLLDLTADHPLGLQALVLCLVGYVAGRFGDRAARSALGPLLTVAVGSAGAVLLYAGICALLSDPRASWSALARTLPGAVLYDVLLAPFVLPAVQALTRPHRGTDTDPVRH